MERSGGTHLTNEAVVALGVLNAHLVLHSMAPTQHSMPEKQHERIQWQSYTQKIDVGEQTWIIHLVEATDCVKQKQTCRSRHS